MNECMNQQISNTRLPKRDKMPNPRASEPKSRSQIEVCGQKLKRFLEHQKRTAQAGPPPTQTTSMLVSLLDGKTNENTGKATKRIVHKSIKVRKPSIGNGEKKDRAMRNVTPRIIGKESTINLCARKISLWDGATKTKPDETLNAYGLSRGSLDDLIQPIQSSAKKAGRDKFVANKLAVTRRKNALVRKRNNVGSSLCKPKFLQGRRDSEANTILSAESVLQKERFPLHLPGFRNKSNLPSFASFCEKKPFLENRYIESNPTKQNDESIIKKDRVSPSAKSAPTPGCSNYPVPPLNSNDVVILPNKVVDHCFETTKSEHLLISTSSTVATPSKIQSTCTHQDPSMTRASLISTSAPSSAAATLKTNKKRKTNNNGNFVRLNLRNKAGSCRGARNLKSYNLQKRWRKRAKETSDELKEDGSNHLKMCNEEETDEDYTFQKRSLKQRNTIHDAIDPIDDFLDGTFQRKLQNEKDEQEKDPMVQAQRRSSQHPLCTRHNRQCKLLVVKKNSSGNRGRKFYTCALPRGEQCDFFQWEDDTIEAARTELLRSSSHSGFVARQVAAHIDRLRALTVPELRLVAKRRRLDSSGSKKVLVARLSVWVRDEICDSSKILSQDRSDINLAMNINLDIESDPSCTDDENSDSEENEELEICGPLVSPERRAKPTLNQFESSIHQCLYDLFGYSSFRDGQEWAIRRCLAHKKTLLVAPTGLGKSLCYILPAALMDGVCIVISPLVSLIADQMSHIPPKLPCATLSGSMSKKDMAVIIDDLLQRRLKILFLSPEKLTSAAFRRLLRTKYNTQSNKYERQLPPVSLLCLDEAHCLSQWGHNFRSSYLRIKSIIETLEPKSILAMTATAGPPVIHDICSTLKIPHLKSSCKIQSIEPCVKIIDCNRENIDVSALFLEDEDQRLQMLLKLLRDSTNLDRQLPNVIFQTKSQNLASDGNTLFHRKMEGCLSKGSVIVYVWRKKDAEIVTEQLQSAGIDGGVVCYHGGMDANARSKAQSKFMRGKVRIIVATVAFGLGINKADVKGVIHMCLPSSPENYQQEIGRAGRDGNKAQAIALCLRQELIHKQSLSFSDKISESQIKTFFKNMQFLVEKASRDNYDTYSSTDLSGLNIAIPLAPMMKSTDLKEETVLTILSILGDETSKYPKMLDIRGIIPDCASVTLKRHSIEDLASKEAIARCIMKCGTRIDARSENSSLQTRGGTAMQYGFAAYSYETIEFSVTQCSRLLGPNAEPRNVYASLRRLQDSGELELNFKDYGRSVFLKVGQEGVNYFLERNSIDFDSHQYCLDDLRMSINEHFSQHDLTQCRKVVEIYQMLHQISLIDDRDESLAVQKSKRLRLFHKMMENFSAGKSNGENLNFPDEIKNLDEKDATALRLLSANVMVLVQSSPSLNSSCSFFPSQVQFGSCKDLDYTATLITKILHGIPTHSTAFLDWYNHHLWGTWKQYSFTSVHRHVEKVLQDSSELLL